MRHEFTAIVEPDGPWYIANCAEIPGANGQGKSREKCLANLRAAIALVLEHFSGNVGWVAGACAARSNCGRSTRHRTRRSSQVNWRAPRTRWSSEAAYYKRASRLHDSDRGL